MTPEELRALQAPIKDRYREQPESALATLRARGDLGGEGISCRVETGRACRGGAPPARRGDGSWASGDMLLECSPPARG